MKKKLDIMTPKRIALRKLVARYFALLRQKRGRFVRKPAGKQ